MADSIEITWSDETSSIDLHLKRPLTIVHDNSATGKTFLTHKIRSFQRRFRIWEDIKIVSTLTEFNEINTSSCKVVIIDKPEQYLPSIKGGKDIITKCLQSNPGKYFLIFSRSALFIPYSIFDVATLNTTKTNEKICITLQYLVGD